jgi:hypothetical protein
LRAPRLSAPVEGRAWRWVLAAALVGGLAVFLRLGDWGLWIDEVHTLHDARALGEGPLPRYPLGYWATELAIRLLGRTDELTLRLVPALFGWLAVGATFWAFAPAAGRTRAAAAALLVAASTWHLFWAQNARSYSMAQFLALAGGGAWLRGLFQERAWLLVAGLVLAALAGFAHPSAALLVPALVLAPLLLSLASGMGPSRLPRSLFLLLGAGCALLLGVWGLEVWRRYQEAKGTWWQDWGELGERAVRGAQHFALTSGWHMTPWLLAGAALGAWLGWRRRSRFDVVVTLVCVQVAVLALAASAFVVVSAQYVFALLPWVAALATAPLVRARDGERGVRWWYLALLAVPMAVDSWLYFAVRHGDRPRWREAYAYVWEERGPLDLVVGMSAVVGEYYLAPQKSELRQPEAVAHLTPYTTFVPSQWARHERRTWFVIHRESFEDWWDQKERRDLERMLEQCRLVKEFRVPLTPRDLDVQVYVRE